MTHDERKMLREAIDRERRREEGLPSFEELEVEERKRQHHAREREELRQRKRALKGDPAYSHGYCCLACGTPVSNNSAKHALDRRRIPRCRACFVRQEREARRSRNSCSGCGAEITSAAVLKAKRQDRPPRCQSCAQRARWTPEARRIQSEAQKARRATEQAERPVLSAAP